MSIETKVGFFVFLALTLAGFAIVKVGDLSFNKRYNLYFMFDDIRGLQNKSPVKIAGVEIGRVNTIELEDGRAKVGALIKQDVVIYENATVKVKQTGFIGSQFLDVWPGDSSRPALKENGVVYGSAVKTLEDLLERVSAIIDGKDGKAGVGENLAVTMANLRSISESLDGAVGQQRKEMKEMIKNIHAFSANLKTMSADLQQVTASSKENIEVSLAKLRSVMERLDTISAKIDQGEGTVGKLVNDEEMGKDLKTTMSNLRDASDSAKQVLGRFTKVRSYWELQARYQPNGAVSHFDGGIRLSPREHKYYYIGVENIGSKEVEYRKTNDFEKRNTITALLGREYGPLTVEVGAMRSTFGVGLKYAPFKDGSSVLNWAENLEFYSRAFDFGRDEFRGKEEQKRHFKKPHYDIGVSYGVTKWLNVGATVEDVAETKQIYLRSHLVFEDSDLAYLFGFISFAK